MDPRLNIVLAGVLLVVGLIVLGYSIITGAIAGALIALAAAVAGATLAIIWLLWWGSPPETRHAEPPEQS